MYKMTCDSKINILEVVDEHQYITRNVHHNAIGRGKKTHKNWMKNRNSVCIPNKRNFGISAP